MVLVDAGVASSLRRKNKTARHPTSRSTARSGDDFRGALMVYGFMV
jgi:hypothetical protein